MVNDQQVRRLFKMVNREGTKEKAALKSGMDVKTARKYLKAGKLPSQMLPEHQWRTRQDPFEEDWLSVEEKLKINPGLETKTLFEELQREKNGKYSDGQLRTLQRRVKKWRALYGPGKEVYFPQKYYPGEICASDFTHMKKMCITIRGEIFEHLIYHFVLCYSNWETGTICYSESYESLSEGLQNALWELGGVPLRHRTDRMSSAVNKECNAEEFTDSYKSLLRHYGIKGEKIRSGKANENGDIEQRHHRFKRALEQSLLIRNSRDFRSLEEYEEFLKKLFKQLQAGRQQRLKEELKVLRQLPLQRLNDCKRKKVKVGPSSTIQVAHNTYSVHSRLIREWVEARIYARHIEIWYAQGMIDKFPRLKGGRKHHIQYRHIIEWLVRKPGAFENYRYRDDLFPSSYFRMAYDDLKNHHTKDIANKEYLNILKYAAMESENKVESIIKALIRQGEKISSEIISSLLNKDEQYSKVENINIAKVNLRDYDVLIDYREVKKYV